MRIRTTRTAQISTRTRCPTPKQRASPGGQERDGGLQGASLTFVEVVSLTTTVFAGGRDEEICPRMHQEVSLARYARHAAPRSTLCQSPSPTQGDRCVARPQDGRYASPGSPLHRLQSPQIRVSIPPFDCHAERWQACGQSQRDNCTQSRAGQPSPRRSELATCDAERRRRCGRRQARQAGAPASSAFGWSTEG